MPTSQMTTCAIPGCERSAHEGDFCRSHARRMRVRGDVPQRAPVAARCCGVAGCLDTRITERYCLTHELRVLRIRESHRRIAERKARVHAALLAAAARIHGSTPRPRPRLVPDGVR